MRILPYRPSDGDDAIADYAKTISLVEARGLDARFIGDGTIRYLLNVERKTPEQVADILCGPRVCRACAEALRERER